MDNKVASNAIASLYNADISYDFYGNQVSFKHIELLPVGQLSEPIQVTLSGAVSKVAWDEPVATMKQVHQATVRGYKNVALKMTDGEWAHCGVHRLVFYSYNHLWSDMSEGTVIHHINGVKNDNRASNLMLTSASDNVSRFFDGRDNQDYIKSQEYKTERINQGTVPLVHKGKLIEGYTINTMGEVYHKHYIKGRNEWKVTKLKASHASKKHRMNLVLNVAGVSASLPNLMAENFLEVPTGYYKTLMKDSSIANPYQPQNLYTVAKKHQ